jgi:hypothetical protein
MRNLRYDECCLRWPRSAKPRGALVLTAHAAPDLRSGGSGHQWQPFLVIYVLHVSRLNCANYRPAILLSLFDHSSKSACVIFPSEHTRTAS